MKQDTIRPPDGHAHHIEADLLAGLWEEAPFARLPWDAPTELREFVEDIENPKRVYAIHRASRRHGFQQLVEKFIVQLREGCGSKSCTTPTCFTCRKQSVGRVPIRRYNTTSARVLAVYMASQDNAENALCPAIRSPKSPPAAVDALLFHRKSPLQYGEDMSSQHIKGHNGYVRGSIKGRPLSVNMVPVGARNMERRTSSDKDLNDPRTSHETPAAPRSPKFQIHERHAGKDYRSFAANMFGTVAFKMLEWLTPNALEDMQGQARLYQGEDESGEENVRRKSSPRPKSPAPKPSQKQTTESRNEVNKFSIAEEVPPAKSAAAESDSGDREKTGQPQVNGQRPTSSPRPGNARRNSNARVRTNSAAKPKRQLSIDTYPPEAITDEGLAGLRSPRHSALQTDKSTRPSKNPTSTLTRPISQISTAGFFDSVPLEKMPPLKPTDIKSKPGRGQVDGSQISGKSSPKKLGNGRAPSEQSHSNTESLLDAPESDSDTTYENHLPQTVQRLNANIVDFMCNVLQEDGTAEKHLLEPTVIFKSRMTASGESKSLIRRRAKDNRPRSPNMKLEWKLFVEQSLFYVLSDPHALIRSFTKKGQLYDSQTLWYCMLRMTRVAPSLVFHSLWLAAGHLFAPPKSVQSLRSPTARLFPKQDKTLSNSEAGILMSICLHALVAAAPLVNEQRLLLDMSRIRSQGLVLAGNGAVARQPAELCLQYDDAFSDDLAIRLARRLLTAITTRRYFNDMLKHDSSFEDEDPEDEPDILAPIFTQLDFLNMDAVYIMDFSFSDRALHETRMPTLLLDWARAVMLHDWDGSPEIPGDGPFGGALALTEAIYKKRQALLIADNQFLSEYFAERLDEIEMPVAWLSFTSNKQRLHLLDFPYIFNPDTLVSYFRAINFQRMNHAHEASSSIKNRMDRFETGTLIINPHHKSVLQDMLRTASAKYLILDIGRKTVIRDAFDQLWRREERELLRPLKVHLGEEEGEEGFDSGGVQQEFFRLAVAEALNPDYGAFTTDERNRMTWFQPGSIESEWKFELVGLLISLAVYNGLTLPVTFPKALYRKLLGEPVTELHHIEDGWPELANGLNQLLEWNEDNGLVDDIFARTYEFSVSIYNEPISREMHSTTPGTQPDPEEWPQFPKYPGQPNKGEGPSSSSMAADNPPDAPMVTNSNRNAYVSDYIRYLTDVSVRPQYEAFARGFRSVLHPKSLTLLSPNLLQKLVEGVQEIDISELKRATRYVGWDPSHKTVKDFWSIVRKYDDRMKRKLLEFVTASDRVPVGGIKNIQFVVQKNGEEEGSDGHLPTAYTCYGTLLLPEYRDRDVLKERLAMALENAQGFGFA